MADSRKQPRAKWAFAGDKVPKAPTSDQPPRIKGRRPKTTEQMREVRALHAAFFEPIIRELQLEETGQPVYPTRQEGHDRGFESRCPPLCFNLGFWGRKPGDRDRAQVYLWICEDDPRAAQIFDELLKYQEAMNDELRQIDPSFELNWWSRSTGSSKRPTYRAIGMQIDGTIDDPQERLDEIRDWMLAFYPALKKVMGPRLADICRRL